MHAPALWLLPVVDWAGGTCKEQQTPKHLESGIFAPARTQFQQARCSPPHNTRSKILRVQSLLRHLLPLRASSARPASFLRSILTMGNAEASASQPLDPAKLNHYVLSTPLQPDPSQPLSSCVFATGCFWGSEKAFWRMPGVYTTAVGYIAGQTPNPTYEQVCSGRTGHTEAVQVFWDPAKLSFADLMREFLQSHDPTQGNGQGSDRGSQYRSGVYPRAAEDYAVAQSALQAYSKALARKCTTEVVFPAPTFYFAEKYHQQYVRRSTLASVR
jgi:peptide-methionine (S)-S-oxide reductase